MFRGGMLVLKSLVKVVVVEKQRENVFTLYHISLLSLFSFTSFFTGASATRDALTRGKSLTREDSCVRTDRDW